jgi:predicted enzyme related to lactoylglutathione lyase
MARITGIGGIFFKSRNDSAALAAWYQKHLGMPIESFGGAVLKWPDDKAEDKGLTVWHIAEKGSEWFSPSDSPFMINYRVDNLDKMIAQLRAGGVEIVSGPESHETGSSRGSWTRRGIRWSCGSRGSGMKRTRAPEDLVQAAQQIQ